MSASRPTLSPAVIQQHIAKSYGLDVRLFKSKRRTRHLIRPRQIAIWLTRELMPLYSLVQIGRAYNRDHTTVMHAIRKIEEMSRRSSSFFDMLTIIQDDILATTRPADPKDVSDELQARELARTVSLGLSLLAKSDPAATIRIFEPIAKRIASGLESTEATQ